MQGLLAFGEQKSSSRWLKSIPRGSLGPLGGTLAALEGSLGLLLESWWAPGALLEASWSLLEPSWSRLGGFLGALKAIMGANWEPKGHQMGAKSSSRCDSGASWQNLKNWRTSHAKSLFLRSCGLLLGPKIVTKYGLRALGSILEPSWGSWRLPQGSWRRLEALLEALGRLLEWPKGGERAQHELEESST